MKHETLTLLWARCQTALTALGAWLGALFGGMDGLLTALVLMMALDYLTGVLCAIEARALSSAVGYRGLCRKALILLLVGVGHVLDTQVAGGGAVVRTAVICFYLSNEGVSLLENASRLGLPVPEKLRRALARLHEHAEEDADDATDRPPADQ